MFRSLALAALVLAATSCASHPVLHENDRFPSSTPASDQDRDGTPDSLEKCPSVPGPASNDGCPYAEPEDADEDGVPDSEDRCPSVKGPASNVGCPLPKNDCTRVRCDGRKPKCEQGEDLVDLRAPGACCPKWSCEPEGDSNEEL